MSRDSDEILTTEEVAALLKVPKATVYRWTSEGSGPPFYTIGKWTEWVTAEVMAWFDSHLDELSQGSQ